MNKSYYFGNSQLYKMPRKWRVPGPDLTPTALSPAIAYETGVGAYQESAVEKALPYVAGGIAAYVIYNIFFVK